ncbi:MAG: folate-binding protein [Hyphomicrobiales bacterium]|nr:folate-binding protein [Hyphomicrobiales bacterium]
MAQTHRAALPDRGVLRISGADAEVFLQGLVTNDVQKAADGLVFAALLSPQGKLLCDFFVSRRDSSFLLDCPAAQATALAKRLAMYKLRSAVTIEEAAELSVEALWGGAGGEADPRLPALGARRIAPRAELSEGGDYHAHRIAHAIPEGGVDFDYGETFPHDACMDVLNGIDFKKGCYVGQEIVSRMQHRGTARRRVVAVAGERLAPGAEIMAGAASLGRIGSVAGERGVAIVRLDRAAEAIAGGVEITAGGAPVTLAIPTWATYAFAAPQPHDAH